MKKGTKGGKGKGEKGGKGSCIFGMLALGLALLIGGCTSPTTTSGSAVGAVPVLTQSAKVNIESATAFLASGVLALSQTDTDLAAKKAIIHNSAVAVAALAKGSLPTPDQFEAAFYPVMPDAVHWWNLSTGLKGLYAEQYEKLSGYPLVMADVLGAIAAGLADATA